MKHSATSLPRNADTCDCSRAVSRIYAFHNCWYMWTALLYTQPYNAPESECRQKIECRKVSTGFTPSMRGRESLSPFVTEMIYGWVSHSCTQSERFRANEQPFVTCLDPSWELSGFLDFSCSSSQLTNQVTEFVRPAYLDLFTISRHQGLALGKTTLTKICSHSDAGGSPYD